MRLLLLVYLFVSIEGFSQNGYYQTKEDFMNGIVINQGNIASVGHERVMVINAEGKEKKILPKKLGVWGVALNGTAYKVRKNRMVAVLAFGELMLYGYDFYIDSIDEYNYASEIRCPPGFVIIAQINDGKELLFNHPKDFKKFLSDQPEVAAMIPKKRDQIGILFPIYMEAARKYNKAEIQPTDN
ncbi:MAG: hypothetical protein ACPGVC_07645 [Salibacteraceae bacterium]